MTSVQKEFNLIKAIDFLLEDEETPTSSASDILAFSDGEHWNVHIPLGPIALRRLINQSGITWMRNPQFLSMISSELAKPEENMPIIFINSNEPLLSFITLFPIIQGEEFTPISVGSIRVAPAYIRKGRPSYMRAIINFLSRPGVGIGSKIDFEKVMLNVVKKYSRRYRAFALSGRGKQLFANASTDLVDETKEHMGQVKNIDTSNPTKAYNDLLHWVLSPSTNESAFSAVYDMLRKLDPAKGHNGEEFSNFIGKFFLDYMKEGGVLSIHSVMGHLGSYLDAFMMKNQKNFNDVLAALHVSLSASTSIDDLMQQIPMLLLAGNGESDSYTTPHSLHPRSSFNGLHLDLRKPLVKEFVKKYVDMLLSKAHNYPHQFSTNTSWVLDVHGPLRQLSLHVKAAYGENDEITKAFTEFMDMITNANKNHMLPPLGR